MSWEHDLSLSLQWISKVGAACGSRAAGCRPLTLGNNQKYAEVHPGRASSCYDLSSGGATWRELTVKSNVLLSKLRVNKDHTGRNICVALTGTNHSDSRRPKKKKRTSLGLNSGGGGGGGGGSLTGGGGGGGGGGSSSSSQSNISLSTKKKRPKLSAPSISSIYDDLN